MTFLQFALNSLTLTISQAPRRFGAAGALAPEVASGRKWIGVVAKLGQLGKLVGR